MHAGIDFQPDIQRTQQLTLRQPLQLAVVMDHHIQPVTTDEIDIIRPKETFKQDNAPVEAGLAQGNRLIQTGHAECGRVGQCLCNADQTMTVGIGLDDGHHLAVWCCLLCEREVVLQGLQVNPCPGGTAHPNSPPVYWLSGA